MQLLKIIFLYVVIGSSIQVIRILAKEWGWLGAIYNSYPICKTIVNLASILVIILGAVHVIYVEYIREKHSVFLVPKAIEIRPGSRKKISLKIINNQNFPIYQIIVKVAVEEGDLSLKDLEINPKDGHKEEIKIGNVTLYIDILGMGTSTEEDFIIREINAHSTKDYIVEINGENIQKKSRIIFKIVRTENNPPGIESRDPFLICKEDKSDFKTYQHVAKIMLNHKRYKESLICCQKALMRDSRSAEVLSDMGIALFSINETDRAIKAFKDAIKIDPKLPDPYLNLAYVFMQQREWQDAIDLLKASIDSNEPKHPAALVLWGQCLEFQNDIKGSIEKYKEAIKLDPEHGPAYYKWGLLLKNNNDCEGAIEKFINSTKSKHEFRLHAYGMWGACLDIIGDTQGALDKYQKIIDKAPNSKEAKLARKSIELIKNKM